MRTMFIQYTCLEDYNHMTRQPYISRFAWRIGWFDRRGVGMYHEIPFPRRRDAELAMKGLEMHGFTDDDMRELPYGKITFGPIEDAMLSALQW